MNKLAFTLGVTTVMFASTTVYFAYAFYTERERAARPPAAAAGPGKPMSAPLPAEHVVPKIPAAPGSDTAQPAPSAAERQRAHEIALKRIQLDRLTDPQSRAEHLANIRNMYRADLFEVAQGVGLGRDELDQLVTLLAERSTRRAEARLRCEVTPGCVPEPANTPATREADRQELIQLLGEQKASRYQSYLDTSHERFLVERMLARIADGGHVSDAQKERLISALADENRRVEDGAKNEGVPIQNYSLSGVLVAQGDPRTAEGRARQLETGAEYIRRLHDRAAQILTPAQLGAFDELQDQQLRQLQENLKTQELAGP